MQRQQFDSFIKNYRKNADGHLVLSGESSEFFARYKVEKLLEWFPSLLDQKLSVLDYGCGDGLMTHYFARLMPQAKIVGVDPSAKSIEAAGTLFKDIKFDVLEGEKLSYDDNSFDLISAAGVFHHIPFEEHEQWFKEVFRVLKPGGRFVLFELNPFNPLTQYVFRTSPVDQDARMLYPSYAHTMLAQYGVNLVSKYYFFYPSWLSWMRRTEKYLTKVPLGGLYAVIAEKK